MKFILKGCTRCGGDLMPDRWDLDGEDMCCVQCGQTVPATLLRRSAALQAVPASDRYAAPLAHSKVA